MTADPQPPNRSKETLRRLYEFMSRRRFVASRRELLRADFGSSQVRNWVRHGRLILLLRGVYSFGHDVRTREEAFRAALLLALIDFAGRASRRQVRFAFLEASRLRLIQKRDMERLRQLMAGRRGVEKLKPMIALVMRAEE